MTGVITAPCQSYEHAFKLIITQVCSLCYLKHSLTQVCENIFILDLNSSSSSSHFTSSCPLNTDSLSLCFSLGTAIALASYQSLLD